MPTQLHTEPELLQVQGIWACAPLVLAWGAPNTGGRFPARGVRGLSPPPPDAMARRPGAARHRSSDVAPDPGRVGARTAPFRLGQADHAASQHPRSVVVRGYR